MVGFKCSGSEKNLGKCGDGVSYTSEISHYYDLVVKCSGKNKNVYNDDNDHDIKGTDPSKILKIILDK